MQHKAKVLSYKTVVVIINNYLEREMKIQTLILKSFLKYVPFNILNKVSEINAIKCFNQAYKIEEYRRFLTHEGYKLNSIMNMDAFRQIPISDKANYINNNQVTDISLNKTPLSFYRSSGYSGKPTYWSQNASDFKDYVKYKELNLDMVFNISSKKTLIVSTFALSSWITGQQVLAGLFKIAESNPNITVFSCGMIVDEPLDLLCKFGQDYEQIIMFFYPLTFKAFVDKAMIEGVDLKKYNIRIILGAEGVTYSWVKHYEELLKTKEDNSYRIFSAFGAADSGIGIAAEQITSLVIKEYCFKDKNILKELTSVEEMPLHFFQYNPLNQYLEVVDGKLIMTKLKQNPLVRYDLHDRAKIISPVKVKEVFKKRGLNIDKIVKEKNGEFLNLPFFAVYGRDDGTIILNGANIYINSFKEALSQPDVIRHHTGKFKVSTIIQKDMFQNYLVEIELKQEVKPTGDLEKKIRNSIIEFLLKNDKGYKNAYHTPYQRDDICKIKFTSFSDNSLKHKYNL